MIELLVLGGIVLLGGAALATADRRSSERLRAQERTWRDAAQACGLTIDPDRALEPGDTLVARDGSRTIRIQPRDDVAHAAARVTVDGLPPALRLWPDPLRAKVAALVDTGAVVLGDPEFDAAIVVEGPALTVRAAFDAPTRRLALDLLRTAGGAAASGGVKNGLLQLHYPDDAVPGAPDPRRFLRQVLDLADRLSGAQVEERLAAIVRADPVAAVRRSALELLRDERPDDPATRRALEDGCADADPLVRLTAALALGPEAARAPLLGLAAAADVPDDLCARALTAVGPHLSADELRMALSAALRARHLATAALGVDLLDRAGASDADALAHLLERSDRGLALAAARALGCCGTAAHVPALRDAQKSAFGFGELADACRAAVDALQSRQGADAPGQLSLSPSGGEVSLADDAGGRLALPRDRAATMGPTEPD